MAFLTEETVDLVRAGSGDFHLIGRPFFYHGAGAGAVSIDVVSGNILGGGYNLDQSEFRSDNPFVFRSHIRHDGTNFYFPRESKGSGTVRLEGGVSGMVWLAAQSADWTGTIVLPEGATWDSTRGAQVSHGTLVIDGTFRISSNTTTGRSFASAAGSLVTGHGTFGRTGFSVTFGGTLAPGRPGEVGTLNFDKSEGSGWVIPTTMESTSVLRFDLLNALSHDRLLWEGSVAVWNLTVVEGAQLELHLLEGFSAQPDDEFHILSGYDSLDGTLQLKDGTVLSENTIFAADAEGEHLFRISYGDGTGTTLTYIPEPGTAALLLAGALLTALRRRRGTTGVCGKS